MTFNELRIRYSDHELSYYPGDRELRYRAFAPFFDSLFDSKVVYYEKFIGIVRLEGIEITPDYFRAVAVPHLRIERMGVSQPQFPHKPWEFGGRWDFMRLVKNGINAPYCAWTIWPEAARVQRVEGLASRGAFVEALQLTLHEPEMV